MKKNLSKNAVKAMALGLAVTMGSSMAINGVYNNTVTVQAAAAAVAQFDTINNDTNIGNIAATKYILTDSNSGHLLFKVESVSGDNLTVKLVGVGTDADADPIEANGVADGNSIPFKAELEGDKFIIKNTAGDTKKTVSNIKIGDGTDPLKTFALKKAGDPTEKAGEAVSFTKDVFQGILDKGVTEISDKALDKVDITGTSADNRLTIPASLTKIGEKGIGGLETDNKSIPLYIDLKQFAAANYDEINVNAFMKDMANHERSVNIKVLDNAKAAMLKTRINNAGNNSHIVIVDEELPSIKKDDANKPKFDKTSKTITLTADEELQVFEKDDNGGFTITPVLDTSKNPEITVTKVEVKDAAKNKVVLTLKYDETDNLKISGTYKINYTKPTEVKLKDIGGNELENISDNNLPITINTESPKLQSAIIKESSDPNKGEIILSFDKNVNHVGDVKDNISIKKSSDNSDIAIEANNGVSNNGANQNEIAIKLSSMPTYSEKYTLSYKGDDAKYLSDEDGNKVEEIKDLELTNRTKPAVGEEITAGEYKVKVSKAANGATEGEVTLIGKKVPTSKVKVSDELSVLNGKIRFDDTTTFVINKVGEGANAIEGDNFTVEELNNLLPEVTEIATKAFDGKIIVNENKLHLTLPKVTKIAANGFGVKSGLENVNLPAYDGTVANIPQDSFANSTAGSTSSVKYVKIPKDKLNTKPTITGVDVAQALEAPDVNEDIQVSNNLSFKVVTKDEYGSDGKQGTVLLKATPAVKAGNDMGTLKDGILSYTKDGVTYEYKLTQVGEGQALGNIDTAILMNNLQNVEEVKENAFENVTFTSKELELPMVTKVGDNAFKGTTGLETVKLPSVTEVNDNNLKASSFGADKDATSVKWIKVSNDKYDTIKNSINNTKVKVIPMTDTTAELSGESIKGTVGTAISNTEIIVKIKGYKEDFKNIDDEGMTFNNWITNLPAGLKVTKKEDVQNNAIVLNDQDGIETKTLKLEISGTPLAPLTSAITMTIPSINLEIGKAVKSTENADLKFEIAAAPSTGGGSSNGGTTGGSSSNNNGSGGVSIGNGVTTGGATTGNTNNNNNNTGNTNNNTGNVTEQPIKQLSIDTITLPAITETSASFTDIPSTHWASSSISKLSSAGIIKGLPDGGFNANGNSKRADVTIILTRLLGLSGASTTSNFTDVDPNAYYADAVNIAKEYGIITGSNGKFNPNSNISRQDTMVMISRILTNLGVSVNKDTAVLAQFADTANVSSYALEATAILVNAGVINGNGGKINPKAAITRAEMSVIIDRLYTIIEAGKKAAESTTTTTTTTTTEGSTETTTASKNASTETTTKTSESSTETTTQKTN